MIYQLNSKLWSLTSQYEIKDQSGNLAFAVVGEFFSWGDNLSVQTAGGAEIAQIRQRLLTLMPKYEIYFGDRHFATIVKEFTWFKQKFKLDVPGPNDYTIQGDFWDYEYEFERGNRIVAQVSRKYWSWTDSYGVEIIDGEDDVSILSAVTVVSLCNQDDDDD
jgi:uncharacterized protein YxjI